MLTVPAVSGTQAAWVDNTSVGGTSVGTGTIDLKVEGADSVANYTALDTSVLESGGSTAAILNLTNSGTAAVDFWVDASSTNADGKGLASNMVARATWGGVTGSPPTVSCSGTAVGGTPKPLGANAIGSSGAPLRLAGGTSAPLCVELALPATAEARGGATTVNFTFNASSSPGSTWTDTVPVAKATLKSVKMAFLKTDAPGNTTSSATLPLSWGVPTLAALPNYDTNRDAAEGLLLQKVATIFEDSTKVQRWSLPVSETLTPSTISLRMWSAVPGFSTTRAGSITAALYNCPAFGGGGCVQITNTSIATSGSWSGGSSSWVEKTWTFGNITEPISAGRYLEVRVAALNEDMMLAYDTTAYRSTLIFR